MRRKPTSPVPVLFLVLVLPIVAGGLRRASAQGIDEGLRDQLTGATVYIETEMTMASRDWSSLPEIIRERIGTRPTGTSSGSGFLISPDGYLLTNAHVVSGVTLMEYPDGHVEQLPPGTKPTPFDPAHPDKPFSIQFTVSWIRVVTNSGAKDQKSHAASLIRVNPDLDLALVKISSAEGAWPFFDIAWKTDLKAGEEVLMSGFPGGVYTELAPFVGGSGGGEDLVGTYAPRPSVNSGLVTAIRDFEGARRYQLDIRANPGNSGGPITRRDGKVVGILYAQLNTMQSINYAIPIDYAGAILPSNLRTGEPAPAAPPDDETNAKGDQTYKDFLDSGNFKF